MEGIGYGAVYGVAQPKLYGLAQQFAPNINPRLLLGGAAALAAWKGRGMVKKAGIAVLVVEGAGQARATTAGLISPSGPISAGQYL